MTPLLANESEDLNYDPNNLLDTLVKHLNLKTDVQLSQVLDVSPPVISKVRHRRLAIGATLLVSMHEVSGLSIKELRELMGDRREKFRGS
ncbi:thiamine phosphate synthase YjbQ (UPF0047 family) [Undibacterium sp. GrIS 1.8]|uniref:hypothetical protein n=1 Tax=Undibacterium sp. GrIS 1.8 TaxID=3143934 RepID=UPI003397E275